MIKNDIKNKDSNNGRVLFDVLTQEGEVKRIVARNVKGGYLAYLKIYDESIDYLRLSQKVDMLASVPIDISQPTDSETKNIIETILPKELSSTYRKLANGIMPEYADLATISAAIIIKRTENNLSCDGLEKLREHYRSGVASEKRGISIKKVITEIAKDFQEEKKLTANKEPSIVEAKQIGNALKKQNQRNDAPIVPQRNQNTR